MKFHYRALGVCTGFEVVEGDFVQFLGRCAIDGVCHARTAHRRCSDETTRYMDDRDIALVEGYCSRGESAAVVDALDFDRHRA